jgi:CRISPR-associated protein Csy1
MMMEAKRLIEDFLLRTKTDFLEKKVAAEIRTKKDQSLTVIAAAREKHQPEADSKYAIKTWFEKAIKDAKPNVTTHPSKFTNPKIKGTTSTIFYGDFCKDGYVKTGNVNSETRFDVSGNSATNTVIFELCALLSIELGDGQKLINLFENDDEILKDFFGKLGLDFQTVKSKCSLVYWGEEATPITHDLIRQVYFPVPAGYHLLSITTPSMLMFEVKRRVNEFDKWIDGTSVKKFRSENKFYADGFEEMPNLTEIGFSHDEFTKMGNVSYLNVKSAGIAYLISSLPPSLKPELTRLPTTDFFSNCLWPNQFKLQFELMHTWLVDSRNNFQVRTRRDEILLEIFDGIVQKIWQLRSVGPEWSSKERFSNLPKLQKIVLDDHWKNERVDDEQFLNEFLRSTARWMILAYKKILGKNALSLNDDELKHVTQLIQEQKEALL